MLEAMFDRLWWFATGVVTGGVVIVRALRRSPRGLDLKSAALLTAADVARLTARLVRAPRRPIETARVGPTDRLVGSRVRASN